MTETPQQPPDTGPEPEMPTGPEDVDDDRGPDDDASDMDAGTPAEEPR